MQVVLTIASNAHELAARAADNARYDMQDALEEVAMAEKIIRRCEIVDGVGVGDVVVGITLPCINERCTALINPDTITLFKRLNDSRALCSSRSSGSLRLPIKLCMVSFGGVCFFYNTCLPPFPAPLALFRTRVELEERRARTECDAAENEEEEVPYMHDVGR